MGKNDRPTHPGHEQHADQADVPALGGEVQRRHPPSRDRLKARPVRDQESRQVERAGVAGYQEGGVPLPRSACREAGTGARGREVWGQRAGGPSSERDGGGGGVLVGGGSLLGKTSCRLFLVLPMGGEPFSSRYSIAPRPPPHPPSHPPTQPSDD